MRSQPNPQRGPATVACPPGKLRALAVAVCLAGCNTAWAGPEGGVVTGGEGAIEISGNVTNVEQLTERLSVQWDSFNLSRQETVNFLQPGRTSMVLNHILQNGPSQINGMINANGHVLLINPRGVVFGENASINVGSLTASTLWMRREDFLNGDFALRALDEDSGTIVNHGLISAAAGGVSLVGERVVNEGLITAELGYVNLASGREAYLTFDEEGFLGVKVTQDVLENVMGEESSVENNGEISAPGGRVILEANVSSGLFDSAVNNSGIIEATGFDDVPAGEIQVLGDTVRIADGSRLSVDGDSGGGEILIGGDLKGENPAVQNAMFTNVDQDVLITANALAAGDGGKVIIWADDTTVYLGQIEAKGVGAGGDGGFAEVSGKETIQVKGTAILTAEFGEAGTLLLDPGLVIIVDGTDVTDPPPDASLVEDAWINAQLALGNLTIATDDSGDNGTIGGGGTENIQFQPGDTISITLANDLTLDAGNDVTLTSDTTITGAGSLIINAGQNDGGGTVDTGGASIAGTLGGVVITGGGGNDVFTIDVALPGSSSVTGGAGDDSYTLTASVSGSLSGQAGDDTFNLGTGGSATSIDGGTNTGVGDEVSYAANGAVITVAVDDFTGIETLTGSAQSDTLQGTTGADTFGLTGAGAGTVGGISFSSFETVDGLGGSDTIEGTGGNDSFLVSAANAGTAIGTGFQNVENLSGLAGNDTFTLDADVTGTIDGGTQTTADTVTYASRGTAATAAVNGFIDIETLVGSAQADTLQGTAGNDSFLVSSADAGTVAGISFSSFENLEGLAGDDTFTLDADVSGTIDGGTQTTADTVTYASRGSAATAAVNGFTNIETLVGSAQADTLQGTAGNDSFLVSSADAGTVAGISFSSFENLEGLAGDDTFTLDADVSGTIDGGTETTADTVSYAGRGTAVTVTVNGFTDIETLVGSAQSDTLQGTAGNDGFLVSSADAGTVAGISFSSFENLEGLAGDDTFTLDADVSGTIDGGTETTADTVSYAGRGTAVTATVNGFTDIETLVGSAQVDTLQGTAGNDGFLVSSADAGTVAGISFSSFENLEGLAGDDTFTLDADVSGTIDGGTETTADTVSYAGRGTAVTATVNGFTDIETLVGSAQADTLQGTAGADTFTITGAGAGSVAGISFTSFETVDGLGASDTVEGTSGNDNFLVSTADAGTANGTGFQNVENLSGLAGDDTFTLDADVSGTIDGGTETTADTVSYAGRGTAVIATVNGFTDIETLVGSAQADTLQGTAGNDTFSLTGTAAGTVGGISFSSFETVDGLTGTDTVEGTSGNDNFQVSAANAGNVNGTAFQDIENLSGLAGDDTFTLDADVSGTIDGGSETTADTVTYATRLAAVTVAVNGFTDIETLIGSAQSDTLQGTTGNDTFSLTGTAAGTVGGISFSSFETVDGLTGTDTVEGTSGDDNFQVSAANAGNVNGTAFQDIENLSGLAGDDTFTLDADVSGTIDGGTETTVDTVSYASRGTAVTVAVTGFTDIETLVGSAQSDTLQGTTGADTFGITGAGAGTVGGISFSSFETVDGLGGSDTVEGTAGDDSFTVSNPDEGSVLGTAFTQVENLSGLAGDDTFTLDADVSGTIDGGSETTADTVTYATRLAAVTVAVNGFTDIETLIGSAQSDTLQGTTGADTFGITGAGAGTVGGISFSSFETVDGLGGSDTIEGTAGNDSFLVSTANAGTAIGTGFQNVENLSGLDGDDTFTLDADVSGTIDGGAETTADTVTYTSRLSAVTMAVNGFTDIEALVGSAQSDTLQGTTGNDSFLVSGADAGTVAGISFSAFENLEGLAGDDTFTLDADVSGSIDGGGATTGDIVTYASRLSAVTVAVDTFTSIETLVGSAQSDTLQGTTGNDTFGITAAGAGTVAGVSFSGFETLDGLAGTDTIEGTSGDDSFLVSAANAGTAIGTGFQDVENLSGLAGDDTFTLDADVSGTIDGGAETTADTVTYATRLSAVTVAVNGFTNIETLVGSAQSDSLQGTAGNDTFAITGAGAGTVGGIAFSSFETVDGLTGTDTVEGTTGDDGFLVSAANAGIANGTGFQDIENLSGLAGDDTFTLDADVSGTIDGGAETTADTVSYATRLSAVTVAVNGFTDIETLVGSAQSDTLQGTGGADTFNISGAGAGSIGGISFSGFETVDGLGGSDTVEGGAGNDVFTVNNPDQGSVLGTAFTQVENLSGLGGDDTFNLNSALSGSIDGGADSGAGDEVSYAGNGLAITVGLDAFTAIEILTGSAQSDTLQGTTGADTFNITGAGAGSVGGLSFSGFETVDGLGGSDTIAGTAGNDSFLVSAANAGTANGTGFQNVENLSGLAGNDTFTLDADVSGTIDGGTQTTADTVTYATRLSAVTVAVNGFTDIEVLVGSAQSDTLQGTTGADTFNITGAGAGSVGGLSFSGFETVDGLGGSDTIAGTAGNDSFLVSAANAGTANGTGFQNVENLSGLAGNDTFTLDADVSGTIDGGTQTTADTVTYATRLSAITVAVNGFTDIEVLVGSAQSDTLQGTTGDDTFTVMGAGAGSISGVSFSSFETVDGLAGDDAIAGTSGDDSFLVTAADAGTANGTGFQDIENLSGLAGNDTFTLDADVSGTIDGGTQTTADTVTYATRLSAITVAVNGFTDIEVLVGSAQSDTLQGTTGDDTFTVTGAGAGSISGVSFSSFETVDGLGGSDTIAGTSGDDNFLVSAADAGTAIGTGFQNVENLSGLAGDDTFTLDADVSGSIDGGTEATGDTVSYATRLSAVTVAVNGFTDIEVLVGSAQSDTLQGTTGDDNISISGAGSGSLAGVSFSSFETVDGLAGDDTVTGTALDDSFLVNSPNAGSVAGTNFNDIENLSGGAGDDTFSLDDDLSGNIDGGSNTAIGDTVTYAGRASAVTVTTGQLIGIETLVGTAQVDTLQGDAGNDSFTVTSLDAGDLNGIGFSSFENLEGLDGDDTFNMNADVSGTIDGGDQVVADSVSFAGRASAVTITLDAFLNMENVVGTAFADTLEGTTGNDTFQVTATNAGTLNATAFSDFENLSGLAGDDIFNLDADVTGIVDGGADVTGDEISYAGRTAAVTVAIDTLNDIEILTGSAASDTLQGTTGNDVFTVSATDAGDVGGIQFSSFENLEGLQGNDSFTVDAPLSGSLSGGDNDDTFNLNDDAAGGVDGGAGSNDIVSYAGRGAAVTVSVSTFANVETLIGSGFADVLEGTTGNDTFTITGANSGSAGVNFSSFETVSGLGGNDSFAFAGGSVSAVIGGAGSDTITGGGNYTVTGANSGTALGVSGSFSEVEVLEGTNGNDSFQVSGGGTITDLRGLGGNDVFTLQGGNVVGTVAGDAGSDEITGASAYVVTSGGGGTAGGSAFTGIETLTGTSGSDSFAFNGGSIGTANGVDGDDSFTFAGGTVTAVADGGAGTDSVSGATNYEVTGVGSGTADASAFANMETLIGTAGPETFTLSPGGSIENVSGLDGEDLFVFNGGEVTGTISGGADTDTISGSSAFVINGINSGTAGAAAFTDVEQLLGTPGEDSFELAEGGSIDSIDGLEGDDFFTLNGGVITGAGLIGGEGTDEVAGASAFEVTADFAGTADGVAFSEVEVLTGTAEADTFTLSAGTIVDLAGLEGDDRFLMNGALVTGTLDAGDGVDSLESVSSATVTGDGAGTANDSAFANAENLVGTDGEDSFVLASGSILQIDAGAGDDTFDLSSGAGRADLLLGGEGDNDQLINDGSGAVITGPGEFQVQGGLVNVSGTELIQSTGSLAGTGQETVQISGSNGILVLAPLPQLLFNGVTSLANAASIDAAGAGVQLLAADFSVGASNVVMQNIASVLNVNQLTGHTGDENFVLSGSDATADTQGTTVFSAVAVLLGGGGRDTLDNNNAGIVLQEAGFVTADGVQVQGVATVTQTGDLTGSDAPETYTLSGGEVLVDGAQFEVTVLGVDGVDGAGGADTLQGASDYQLLAQDGGTADGRQFSNIENLVGTAGNDTFNLAQGDLSGSIDGLGQADTGVGDSLVGVAAVALDQQGNGSADAGTSFTNIELLDSTGAVADPAGSGGTITAQGDGSEFLLNGTNAGVANGIAFSGFGQLVGTEGDDSFTRQGEGVVNGSIDALGEGEAGDSLVNFNSFTLESGTTRGGSADGSRFENIEVLVGTEAGDSQLAGASLYRLDGTQGTADDQISFSLISLLIGSSGADDQLIGGSQVVLDGRNSGTANDFFSFSGIENIVGTAGDDSFDLSNGSLDGTISGSPGGAVDSDTLLGANYYEFDGNDSGFAAQSSGGSLELVARFGSIENFVGTIGSDTFVLMNFMPVGTVNGLDDEEEDLIVIVQTDQASGSGSNLEIQVASASDGILGFAGGQPQLAYTGIENFQLDLQGDLILSGSGQVFSRQDVNIRGDLNMLGPSGSDSLTLLSDGNVTVRSNLLMENRSIIDLVNQTAQLTVGGTFSVDVAGGSQVNGLVSVRITEEPVVQLEVEETTSLSVFDEIGIFSAGRSSVARDAAVEINLESDLINALGRSLDLTQ